MSLEDDFASAQTKVKSLSSRPTNADLLSLYSLFKQGTDGDCSGKRPGMFDVKGRAKFDSWAKIKGTSADDAKAKYVALVKRLMS